MKDDNLLSEVMVLLDIYDCLSKEEIKKRIQNILEATLENKGH